MADGMKESYGARVNFLHHLAAHYIRYGKRLDKLANKLQSEKLRKDFVSIGDPHVVELTSEFIKMRSDTLLPLVDKELNALLTIAVP